MKRIDLNDWRQQFPICEELDPDTKVRRAMDILWRTPFMMSIYYETN